MSDASTEARLPAAEAIARPVELLAAMSRDFADSRDIDDTLRKGLMRISNYLDAAGGALFLLDDSGEKLSCTCSIGANDIEGLTLASDQGIVGRSVQNNRGELVRDVRADPSFFGGVDEVTGFVTRSIICAPMSVRDECIGAIELVNKRGTDPRFNLEDLHILEAMASSAALAILNAHMAEALVEQERVRHELELAAEIQRSLLPDSPSEDYPVHGVNLPAFSVSGDFYDFFALDDGRICFNLGDVSGKGMNAALLMAKTSSLYRCLGKSRAGPGALLARINTEICETATRGMFVTMVAGIYDPATGHVRLVNAGHEPPLLHRGGSDFTAFPADAIPLGIVPSPVTHDAFPESSLDLEGGSLYVFTDGVTEGYVQDGEVLEVEGLQRVLAAVEDAPPSQRLESVVALFRQSGRPFRDDVTLLVIDDSLPYRRRHADAAGASGVSSPRPPSDEDLIEVTIPSRPDRLRLVRQEVSLAAGLCCGDPRFAQDLVLAVDEACQNVIRHAYKNNPNGRITVSTRRQGDDLVVLIRDYADPIDVSAVRPRDLEDVRPGGLGTHLMRELLDGIEFLPTPPDGGNLLKLVKRIGCEASNEA